ncbi:MAG TPA: MetQ/NlpA family ABC transporter substrate-binding protein [Candidatus Scatomorpha pullicola]|nr:MetQ/NlpA family ABC transporter substrate-binding protein [Candidatus Scatomorpha pullicola]
MKKILALTLSAILCLGLLAGCGTDSGSAATDPASEPTSGATNTPSGELETITVGASSTPHAEILDAVRGELETLGYNLEVVVFNDYVQPNTALADGDLDANYFQHEPYLTTFNSERGTDLVSAGAIHYEPMGIYPGTKSSLDDIAEGDTIAIPNDGSNETRALLLLQDLGYITLADGIDASSNATIEAIVDNPLNLEITEMNAENIPHILADVAFGIINGNYALQADLTGDDALASESADSDAAQTYANIVACRNGDENSDKIQALITALTSETCREYIESTYNGAVVPIF